MINCTHCIIYYVHTLRSGVFIITSQAHIYGCGIYIVYFCIHKHMVKWKKLTDICNILLVKINSSFSYRFLSCEPIWKTPFCWTMNLGFSTFHNAKFIYMFSLLISLYCLKVYIDVCLCMYVCVAVHV